NAELIALTNKIRLHRDASANARYPGGIPNRFVVTLNNGRALEKEVEFPRGHAGNPMTDAEVEKKFRALVEPKYGKQKMQPMLDRCWSLEKQSNVTELLDMFS